MQALWFGVFWLSGTIGVGTISNGVTRNTLTYSVTCIITKLRGLAIEAP